MLYLQSVQVSYIRLLADSYTLKYTQYTLPQCALWECILGP